MCLRGTVRCPSRAWKARAALTRLAGGLGVGLVAWPYYSFFDLFGVGDLEDIHRSLYRNLLPHFSLALLGVAALAMRLRRDHRAPWF